MESNLSKLFENDKKLSESWTNFMMKVENDAKLNPEKYEISDTAFFQAVNELSKKINEAN